MRPFQTAAVQQIVRACAIPAAAWPAAAAAQSITVAPLAAGAVPVAIPVDNPWGLLALAVGVAAAGWYALRRRQHAGLVSALWATAVVCGMLWHSPALRAQLVNSFTDPSGETQGLAVVQNVTAGAITGFVAQDFSNDSGVPLSITGIQPPSLTQCFPGGFANLAAPGAPLPSPPPTCAVGGTIAVNASCRVNVESICRQEAAQAIANQATLSVSSTALSFDASATGTLTIHNTGAQTAHSVQAAIPAGSGITVFASSCGPTLAPAASCAITFAAVAPQASTAIGIAGLNTASTTVQLTVTVPQTTLAVSPSTLAFAANDTGSVTVTNSGAHPARQMVPTIPGGSGIAVSATTCASTLAPGASCSITFTANAQEGPTSIGIQGDNTNTVAVAVTVSPPPSNVELGALHINGSCGIMGIEGPGFTLTADPGAALPVGTSVLITGSGAANIGLWSITGGSANVEVLSTTSRRITLTAALPAGATLSMRTTLSINTAFTLNAGTTLPSGHVGTGAKLTGTVSSTLILCSTT